MPADISGYDYKILVKGYSVVGDAETGYHATVPYKLPWNQAFHFIDEVMGANSAVTVGPITYKAPYRFPDADANLYARRFRIDPIGAKGDPADDKDYGLGPGEFFTHAIVTVEFETPGLSQQPTESPLMQFDPSNPITVCRQSVRMNGKMETIKGKHYVYDGTTDKVDGDYALPSCEVNLDCEFPQIPYMPWQYVEPFIGKINSAAILGVDAGRLLLEGMDTRIEATTQGMSQNIVLSFAVSSMPTWNHLPKPDGTPALVKRAGSSDGIYQQADFTEIFAALNRVEV